METQDFFYMLSIEHLQYIPQSTFHLFLIKVRLINASTFIKSGNCLLLHLNISFKTAWGLIPDSQRHLSSTDENNEEPGKKGILDAMRGLHQD